MTTPAEGGNPDASTPPVVKPTTGFSAEDIAAIIAAIKSQPDSSIASNVEALAQTHLQYERIGRGLRPNLKADGSNFPEWADALNLKVLSIFQLDRYFDSPECDDVNEQARIIGTVVEYSVDPTLSPFVAAKSGREAYRVLKERFGSVSWSYVISKWMKLMDCPELCTNPNKT